MMTLTLRLVLNRNINRDILECKLVKLMLLQPRLSHINRDILECKFQPVADSCTANLILIETYWNVNEESIYRCVYGLAILIETYWNVNDTISKQHTHAHTILIETYWNVN